ncbi:MAG: rhodanese-like domain-containing protein [Planctomycetota bacterium]|nr:rhodanese-like domain-containing protein [Planctomycetota bacterium]
MFLKQFYLGCLAHASYLIGDESSKVGIVIDPQRDIDQYLAEAEKQGITIQHVFLTHFHADFVAGHLELQKATGATIHLGDKASASYPFEAMADGSTMEWGQLRLKVLSTPGHTPESVCLVLFDLQKDAENAQAVFTGDTLFVGDVGRPDLMASVGITAEDLAGMMYDSLHQKLMPFPDSTLVYPAHGAGSMCGKNLGSEKFTTIGEQREKNYALQEMSKAEFVEMLTANLAKAPKYFAYDTTLNKKARPTLDIALEKALTALTATQVLQLKEKAQWLDVRSADDFAKKHLKGSLNIGLGGKFASWAGSLLDPTIPIVILAAPGTETEAATRLGRIGFDNVAGYLDGGLSAISDDSLFNHSARVNVQELKNRLREPKAMTLLDVRTCNEFKSKRIPGAVHIPLSELSERACELPKAQPIVIHCAGGYRSSSAMSLLRAQGFGEVTDLIGGINAWIDSKEEVISA